MDVRLRKFGQVKPNAAGLSLRPEQTSRKCARLLHELRPRKSCLGEMKDENNRWGSCWMHLSRPVGFCLTRTTKTLGRLGNAPKPRTCGFPSTGGSKSEIPSWSESD